jgi:ribosome-binding factor A
METQRQRKFSRLIQKELAEIFLKDAQWIVPGAWVSVTVVRMSPDLGVAKVFISFLMTEDKNAQLKKVQENAWQLRKMLGERIRKQVRIIPELIFYLDDTADYAAKIDKLMLGLDIPKEDQPEKENDKEED